MATAVFRKTVELPHPVDRWRLFWYKEKTSIPRDQNSIYYPGQIILRLVLPHYRDKLLSYWYPVTRGKSELLQN